MTAAAAPAPPDPQLVARFRADCAAQAAAAGKLDSITIRGREEWLFLAREFEHVAAGQFWGEAAARVSKAAKPEQADPLPVILDFKAQLDKAGVELLLVPVPCKAFIYPDKTPANIPLAADKPPRLDTAHQKFYQLLRDQGVAVLDLTDAFLAHRLDPTAGPAYCTQDSHWSGQGCVIAAGQIAAALRDRPWLKSHPTKTLTSQTKTVEIKGDLWQSLQGRKPVAEKLPLRFVAEIGAGQPLAPDRASPIVLMGDSHNLVFHAGADMHAAGAGLPDQLALELGFPVDLVAVRGSGATPARINLMRLARADANYLAGKKVVIWCFSAREFTESAGWLKVPLTK
jgi:alginate O-acetyltransferase complex protein AlgJ